MREWISTKDRLPEDDYMVLAVVNGNPLPNVRYEGAYCLAEYIREEGWIIDEYPDWLDADVTHWMPLPPEPEGGDR